MAGHAQRHAKRRLATGTIEMDFSAHGGTVYFRARSSGNKNPGQGRLAGGS
jgi:hypothetical protein